MSTTPAPDRRRYGPAIARWRLPSVRVGRQGDVITVEQRVPARVESFHVSSRSDSPHGISDRHYTPIYEAGQGSPTTLTLVKERLTIPAGAVISEQQVRQAVSSAIGAYDPGTAALSKLISGDALLRLLRAVVTLVMAGFGLYFLFIPLLQTAFGAAPTTPFNNIGKFLLAVPGLFIILLVAIFVIDIRAAWALRTPKFVAEEQWQLLRATLTQLAGQEPGSSRPLDLEAGGRPDLITHPNGAPTTRGVTRDGRMAPPWPDAYEVSKRVRQGRRSLVGMAIFASVFLIVGILIFALLLASWRTMLTPLILGVSMFSVIVTSRLKHCDRLIVSYPDTMPGGEEPQQITWVDVDIPSLPTWCDARRRERCWNLATAVFGIQFFVTVLTLFAAIALSQIMFTNTTPAEGSASSALMSNSVQALIVTATALVTIVIGRRWVQHKDLELRHQAGLI